MEVAQAPCRLAVPHAGILVSSAATVRTASPPPARCTRPGGKTRVSGETGGSSPLLEIPRSPATGAEHKHAHDTVLQVCSTLPGKTIFPSVPPAEPQFVTVTLR